MGGVSLLVSIIKDTVPPTAPHPLLPEESQHLLPASPALKVALSHRAPANPSHTAQVIKTSSARLPAPHTSVTEAASAQLGSTAKRERCGALLPPAGSFHTAQADGKEKTDRAGRATSLPPRTLTHGDALGWWLLVEAATPSE